MAIDRKRDAVALPAAQQATSSPGSLASDADLRLAAVAESALALSSPWAVDQVLDLIMDRLTWALHADRSTLFLVEGDELCSKLAQGKTTREIRVRFGQGIAGWVAVTGRNVNVKDAYADPRFDPSWDAENLYRTRSMLCQPVYDRNDNLIAVAQVLNKKDAYFSVDDERLLATMLAMAAILIVNAQLATDLAAKAEALHSARTDVADRAREIDSLYELDREAVRAPSFEAAALGVIERLALTVTADVVEIATPTSAGGCVLYRQMGTEPAVVLAISGRGVHASVFDHGKPTDLQNVSESVRARWAKQEELPWVPTGGLCVPMLRDDELIGSLAAIWQPTRATGLTEERVRFLELAGTQIGHSLGHRLARTQAEREDRLAAIGGALAGVVHDLKTPMTVASGYAQLLKFEADQTERERLSDGVVDQLRRMNEMTREVLGFARGDVQILPRKTLMPEWLEEVRRLVAGIFDGSGIGWEVRSRERGVVRMDSAKILRAVQNLARNSRDALIDEATAGGAPTFALSIATEGAELVIVVSDNGPGVPRAFEHRLYEAFATHGKRDGTGLGLAMVKQVADAHSGSILHRQTPGGGATFELRIPRELAVGPARAVQGN